VIYVVCPVHNRRAVTVRFAERLRDQARAAPRLVLVDDGSTDGTGDAVRAVLPTAVVLRGDGHLWWAGALQKGLNWLRAQGLGADDVVVTMNDDIDFPDDYFANAAAELAALGPGNFLVSPGRYSPSGRWAWEAGTTDWSRMKTMHFEDRPESIDHSTTRCLFMFWGDLDRVGGFHPTLLPHYLSDYEFTMRAHRKGIRLVPAQTVCATFFDETTGDHGLKKLRGSRRLARYFSHRFSSNPQAWFFFIWYACPWPYKLTAWARALSLSARHLV